MQILIIVGISHANVLKISKCFYLTFIFAVCYFPTGISNVIIIYKEKGKTDDLRRKLSTQNIIRIRFLLCKFVQHASWFET